MGAGAVGVSAEQPRPHRRLIQDWQDHAVGGLGQAAGPRQGAASWESPPSLSDSSASDAPPVTWRLRSPVSTARARPARGAPASGPRWGSPVGRGQGRRRFRSASLSSRSRSKAGYDPRVSASSAEAARAAPAARAWQCGGAGAPAWGAVGQSLGHQALGDARQRKDHWPTVAPSVGVGDGRREVRPRPRCPAPRRASAHGGEMRVVGDREASRAARGPAAARSRAARVRLVEGEGEVRAGPRRPAPLAAAWSASKAARPSGKEDRSAGRGRRFAARTAERDGVGDLLVSRPRLSCAPGGSGESLVGVRIGAGSGSPSQRAPRRSPPPGPG